MKCVLSPWVRINSFAQVEESILMHNVNVGRNVKLKKVIVDKDVEIPAGIEIGYDRGLDESRGFYVSEGGVTVVPKRTHIEA